MRHQGRINEWRDDRGFGFIEPNDGGLKVYLHVSSMTGHQRRPAVGDLVAYEVETDHKGRPLAKTASFIGARSEIRDRRRIGVLAAGAALALAFVAYVAYANF